MDGRKMITTDIVIIGGGAAGLMAAAGAGKSGAGAFLLEALDECAKKIHVTGNGRCNLTNLYMEEDCFFTGGKEGVLERLSGFGHRELMAYFEEAGVLLHDRNGYVYPRTDQAAVIARCLVRKAKGRILTGQRVLPSEITFPEAPGAPFLIETKDAAIRCRALVLATGGRCGKAFGCRGDGYQIAEKAGHTVRTAVPALTPLLTDLPYLSIAAGVRAGGAIRLYRSGRLAASAEGEIQLLSDAVSGIPAFQVSREASYAVLNKETCSAVIDFLPEVSSEEWEKIRTERLSSAGYSAGSPSPESLFMTGGTVADLTDGLVHPKIASMAARSLGLVDEKKLRNLSKEQKELLPKLLDLLREFPVPVRGTAGFEKAQVTAGGIPLDETDIHFGSVKCPGLFLAGELLDVDGLCGGYNLTWAMCSGYLAGAAAGAFVSGSGKEAL